MREIAEHRGSGTDLFHQNSIANECFERGGYLASNFSRRPVTYWTTQRALCRIHGKVYDARGEFLWVAS
jgi:hypothetical protein